MVAGALANKPFNGGEAWVRMSWVRGLQRLGLDVWFVEKAHDPDPGAVEWFREVTGRFGLAGRSALVTDDRAPDDELMDLAPGAVLVNISGHLADPRLFGRFAQRVHVDIDPGFTQFWHADGNEGARVAGHELHFTIGEHIGTPRCEIPTGLIDWHPVRQPVVLDDWPVVPSTGELRFTTVANWRGPFGPVEHGGNTYGLKLHEFRKVIGLPRRVPHRLELALQIHPDEVTDIAALTENGWHLVDPSVVARDPDAFRTYVQGSSAEFTAAQGVYVDTACGWFSDRTTRYLASGKPAVVQDTGLGHLPTGDGLLTFQNLDDAVAAVEAVAGDYAHHAAAARQVAERWFAAEVVLPPFCAAAGIGLPARP